MDRIQTKPYYITAAISLLYIICTQIVGSIFFENNWAFLVWENLSKYYLIALTVIIYILGTIILKRDDILDSLFKNFNLKILSLLIFICFILFRVDSFVFAGGNHYLNELAQSKLAVIRVYEFFSIAIIKFLFSIITYLNIQSNTAGVLSFQLFSYMAGLASFFFAFKTARLLHSEKRFQIFIFSILFFGPQSLLYFGFIGVASVIVTSILSFIYFLTSYLLKPTGLKLLLLFLTTITGIFFHIASVVLLPVLIFCFVKHLLKKNSLIPFVSGLLTYMVLFIAIYFFTSQNYEFSKYILFTDDNLHHSYDLQSLKHVGDVIMLVLLFFPQLIAVKFLFFKHTGRIKESYLLQSLMILSVTCMTLIVIMEPIHTIVLDAPFFAVFLTPLAMLLAYILKDNLKSLKIYAVLSMTVLLTYFPVFISLENTESIMKEYLEKNNQFYTEAGTAIQDSYFYQKKIDQANYWYINLDKLSQDFLDLTVAAEYTSSSMYPDAQRVLLRLKNKFRYWVEPRFQNAEIELALKRFVQAKTEIDSTLLIEPYNKKVNRLLYNYHRDLGNFVAAESQINTLIRYYPFDYDIRTDQVIINYRLNNLKEADSIATYVIEHDSTQAFSYLIKGFIAEINKNQQQAISNFENFIKYAPNEPETASIRKRLNDLILQSRN